MFKKKKKKVKCFSVFSMISDALYYTLMLLCREKKSEETLKGEQLLANLTIDFQFQYLFFTLQLRGRIPILQFDKYF